MTGKDIKVGLRFLIFNDFNEVLLMRPESEGVDRNGNSIERWMTFGGWLKKGKTIEEYITKYIKEQIDMDFEMIRGFRPVELITGNNGSPRSHTVLLGFRLKPMSDVRSFGIDVKTIGWFTKQEIRWFWDKIDEDTQRVLVASEFVKPGGLT